MRTWRNTTVNGPLHGIYCAYGVRDDGVNFYHKGESMAAAQESLDTFLRDDCTCAPRSAPDKDDAVVCDFHVQQAHHSS